MSASWYIELVGDTSDLAALAQSLNDPQCSVSHDGRNYVLSSSHFDVSDDANAVKKKAEGIIDVLNGASRLALDSTEAIRVGRAYRQLPTGGREIYAFVEPGVIRFRGVSATVSLTKADGSVQKFHPADPVREWFSLATSDKAVADVFRVLASGTLDWVNLYRIFEIIEQDAKGTDAIVANGWATKSSIGLFKHTANSPGAVGLEARHGKESTQPPPKPMGIAEARSLLNAIIHGWLRAKSVTP